VALNRGQVIVFVVDGQHADHARRMKNYRAELSRRETHLVARDKLDNPSWN